MKEYMTTISSSVYKKFFGVRDLWLNSKAIKEFDEPNSYDSAVKQTNNKNNKQVKVYEFRHVGCGRYDYIILEGDLGGTIWQGSFEWYDFTSRNKSFYDYILDYREEIH